MKSILITVCILLVGNAFSQNLYSNQFWNHSATFNPAMSAFMYKHHSALSLPTNLKNNKYLPKALNLESNFRIADVHGLGVSFHSEYNHNETNINYNYQFKIGEEGTLSSGIGLGLCNNREIGNFYDPFHDRVYHFFNVNLGIAFRMKNFSIGLSTQNVFNDGRRYYYNRAYGGLPLLLLQSEYTFNLNEKFTLTPRVLLASSFSDYQNQDKVFGKINLTAQHMEGVSFGMSYSLTNHISANLGYDILKKFRVSYEITRAPNDAHPFDPKSQFTHELSLGYFIK